MVKDKQLYDDLFKHVHDLTIAYMNDKKKMWRLAKTMKKIMVEYKKEFGEYPNGTLEYMKLRSMVFLSRAKPYKYSVKDCVVFMDTPKVLK